MLVKILSLIRIPLIVQLTQQITFSVQDNFATYAETQTNDLTSKNILKKETTD